jgi:phenylalanyl-tRNA synthetase beta chain
MRVSLRWLEEYVRIDVPVPKLHELLDLSGTKVEAVHQPGKDIDGIVVAEVLEVLEHPNADNLTLVDIRAGGQQERVVCGARNIAAGDKVPWAQVGARLPGLEISERKIRGEVSRGMLCSAAELGLSKDHSGILVLPGDSSEGADVKQLLGLDDTILELEITPNRPDCMGMIGIAREVGALLGNEVTIPDITVPLDAFGEAQGLSVRLEDSEGCPRYVAHLITGVAVGPSIAWMAARLLSAGVRPISNVVDATNYVLLETGHPLHAFDANQVADRTIVVRRARSGERIKTLDGVDRALEPTDLLIADPKRALALAGIMGGEDSEVTAETTEVILEAAYFDAATVGRTSRRMTLRTEASARFERGADPEILPYAAARCAAFISSTPPVQIVDEYPVSIERRQVSLRPQRTSQLLGFDISTRAQVEHLRSVGLDVVSDSDETVDVVVPSFRADIQREVDLIEEVARLAGFDRLPSTVPKGAAGGLEPMQVVERSLRRLLVGLGVSEAWTTSLGSVKDIDDLGLGEDHPARRMVALANPMSEQEDRLRTSLFPGLLRSVARNVSHRVTDVALFEISRIYEATSGARLPAEPTLLAAAFTGYRRARSWHGDAIPWGFFQAKGVLTSALGAYGLEVRTAPHEGMPFHPTRAAGVLLGEEMIGSIGELHPSVCERFDVPDGTVAFEVALAPVLAALPGRSRVSELPKFPPVVIDLAVVVDEEVAAETVERAIRTAGSPELTSLSLFDVYRGSQIPDGKKSLAYALQMRASDRTLTDEDAVAVRERIVGALRADLNAELRG